MKTYNKNSQINIGIIGPGRVAARHAHALQHLENARLWSIAGRNLSDVERFAKEHHAQAPSPCFLDVSEMLADEALDAVIIATPDKLHITHIMQAISSNKSILVEKPLCTSQIEIEQIASALQDFKKTFAVGYHLRWHSGLRQIAKQCHQNELGKLHHLQLSWAVDFFAENKWRTNPQYSRWLCLTVLGTHLLDILRWWMVPSCGEIIRSHHTITNKYQTEFDETVNAEFEFESGAKAELFCSITSGLPFSLQLTGEKAEVIGKNLVNDNRAILINQSPLIFQKNNPYIDQLTDFLSAIQQTRSPEVGFKEATKNVKQLLKMSENN